MTMDIKECRIKVSAVYENYENDEEEGVTGYNDRLDIRPKYQREFVYKPDKRDAVIDTVLQGLPLNVMYWAKTGEDTYEVLDGQQRTISLMEYVDGNYSVEYDGNSMNFDNLPQDIQQRILDYELFVYICDGTDSEKLKWFKTINIAGERLTDQELRNAVYAGTWTASAKKYFSKSNCAASRYGSNVGCEGYVRGDSIRQEILETAISWIADRDHTTIDGYMSQHQNDQTAQELWSYFRTVIDWAEGLFTQYRKEMKGLPWGIWYNQLNKKTADLDPKDLESKVSKLMCDEDVQKKSGVYEYLLFGNENALNVRAFSERDKRQAYERQKGVCPLCGKQYPIEKMQADHIKPWSEGGQTIPENCQMLCTQDNIKKSNR
ncbi:DUF262 domain-containing protein [Bifidobacterium sp. ESL0769]|uniref:GmrSD restriction endonuclease domain-containing protein n=1 Tax=Bifidobacterium sp. ESL0769 TaxID=2983229 RepID=UPI0023F69612|nr:DUF262 domain-containing protein [Bifidobacterium sp. ESL0769]WEV67942.1 DUF262 domain-containing protein [Bifidobacterium sp. ESL0769]